MPYEDDYKMWLEKMLIESNPDWVCDGMYDKEITRNWCVDYCGEDDEYITPKCLHMYYHHIAKADRKTENSSEIPNNCEHITEDGVTCAKYPACDYCLDNPLNKIKGSERLVKGKIVPTISKMEQVEDEPQTDEEYINNLPWKEVGNGEQTENLFTDKDGDVWEWRGDAWYCISGDEPQTEERTIQGTGDCEHCSRLFVDCDGR